MAELTIGQMAAVSYPEVIAENKKPENQWAESTLMKFADKLGMIDRRNLGENIEAPLDYRRNPGAKFLATDMTPVSLAKTEVITAASYVIAQLSVPVVWSKFDDAKNPSQNQKVAFVKGLLDNGIQSHDDLIEEALFTTSTDGFLGLQTLIPTSGQGTVGGIDAGSELFWRNPADTYLADGSDIEAVLTEVWNIATKGTGGSAPRLLVSGQEANALFESTQVSLKRFMTAGKADGGFESVSFKTAPFIYSQHGDDKIYGLNPRAFRIVVSKQYFRDKGETRETEDANGFVFKIYSALQSVLTNKSRVFVVSEA